MGEAEGRQEKDEAGRPRGSAPGSLPGSSESDGLALPPIEAAPAGRGELPQEQAGVAAKSVWREYLEAIVIAVVLALFIRTFVVQAFKIPSGSMIPTLTIGDHILVNKLSYGLRMPFLERYLLQYSTPQRGEVVVFIYPEDRTKDFIKRVIGVA